MVMNLFAIMSFRIVMIIMVMVMIAVTGARVFFSRRDFEWSVVMEVKTSNK